MTTAWTTSFDAVLSRLERAELAWLSWGRVDGSLTLEEVTSVATDVVGPIDAAPLIENLLDIHLLIDVGTEREMFRTRFGESVRLLARNRQLIPNRDWRQAPQLVNDFRVASRPRSFPRREISREEVTKALDESASLSPQELKALDCLLTGAGSSQLLLSRFQLDAASRIRKEVEGKTISATVISAGTGSGKTKAFYIPALSMIAGDLDDSPWARVLAIYPRNELLKDQIAEALGQVELVAAGGGPIISVGALFGPTAFDPGAVVSSGGWRQARDGYACRYLRCPTGCGEDLIWRDVDRRAGIEVVGCPSCNWRSRPGQISLTRRSITDRPPHVLFTTTEMLNRALAHPYMLPVVIGRGQSRRPRLLLLDEIHTYSGIHGGQVAYLLRRWRHALGRATPLHVVGLSATLESPTEFTAGLTGISDVAEVRPYEQDLEFSGAEYSMILRGNPVSGTALLSTTIQSTFLLARLLEARSLPDRSGTSGSKVFAFTDALDVTNRLFWDVQSAEGSYSNRQSAPLASLRARTAGGDSVERDVEGQIWALPPLLGHPLTPRDRLRVARTSGQDAGVDASADVIVATSSLEVGFDDPDVGAVIQHKAPRDDASFLQRRGRAGRRQQMRPWTLVVLSDYGRDRVRYQGYETLLAPTLDAKSLPIDNLHVIKMQAAFAMLDWLCLKVPFLRARADLAGPVSEANLRAEAAQQRRTRQVAAGNLLREVLTSSPRARDLERHVRSALDLDPEQLRSVMWSEPRALMTGVIPTLLRRIESDWTTTTPGRTDRWVADVPLPEHAPASLFSDLNLPEVRIVAPTRGADDPDVSAMPVVQALTEFAVGRASRRFGVASYTAWHWVPVPEPGADGQRILDLHSFATDGEVIGALRVPGEVRSRVLFRPWRLELQLAGRNEQSSNGRATWRSEVSVSAPGWEMLLPGASPTRTLIRSLDFHTHALGNEVEIARGVVGSVAQSGGGLDVEVDLAAGADLATPGALGFREPADAIRVRLRRDGLPTFTALPTAGQRAALTAWFEELLTSDEALKARASYFSIGWLGTLFLAAVAGVGMTATEVPTLDGAVRAVEGLGVAVCLHRALEAVFVVDEPTEGEEETRGIARLRALIDDEAVAARLAHLGKSLVSPDVTSLNDFVARAASATIGVALREAFQRLCPSSDAESLIIDVAIPTNTSEEGLELWLSEPEIGSAGTVEEIRRRASAEPLSVATLFAGALKPSSYEAVDWSVTRALREAREGSDLARAFLDVRAAETGEETTRATRGLRAALRGAGVAAEHDVVSTLNLRILRPGSSPATDAALLAALDTWRATEELLGIELDARIVAYAMSRQGSLDLEQVYSLLWPRGRAARTASLGAYSRFSTLPAVDRLLIQHVVNAQSPAVEVGVGDESLPELREALRRSGAARLVGAVGQGMELQRLLMAAIAQPIDIGSLLAYPRATGAERTASSISVFLELQEALR